MWRINGLDGAAAVIPCPSVTTRPDMTVQSPGAGPATCVCVSKDDDLIIAGFGKEAWVYEATRGRPIQQILIPVPGLTDGESLYSAPIVTHASAVVGAGLVLVASSIVQQQPEHLVGLNSPDARDHSAVPALVSELLLYDNAVSAASCPAPAARLRLPAKVNCIQKTRGACAGDFEGPGGCLLAGLSNGQIYAIDMKDLTVLMKWTAPEHAAVHCIDISPCTGYFVAGCSDGLVGAFALPAFLSTVPCDSDLDKDDSLLDNFGANLVQFGAAAYNQVENAKQVAKSAKAIAGEAGSVVKGIFGSIFVGKRK
jgi:hypothetical protein